MHWCPRCLSTGQHCPGLHGGKEGEREGGQWASKGWGHAPLLWTVPKHIFTCMHACPQPYHGLQNLPAVQHPPPCPHRMAGPPPCCRCRSALQAPAALPPLPPRAPHPCCTPPSCRHTSQIPVPVPCPRLHSVAGDTKVLVRMGTRGLWGWGVQPFMQLTRVFVLQHIMPAWLPLVDPVMTTLKGGVRTFLARCGAGATVTSTALPA
jgi:hypothetical protein